MECAISTEARGGAQQTECLDLFKPHVSEQRKNNPEAQRRVKALEENENGRSDRIRTCDVLLPKQVL